MGSVNAKEMETVDYKSDPLLGFPNGRKVRGKRFHLKVGSSTYL